MAAFRLTDFVRDHARDRGDLTALTGGARSVTYGELEDRSARIASGLRELGIGHGGRVVWLGKNAVEFFELLFAAALIYSGIFWATILFLVNACAMDRRVPFGGVGLAVGLLWLTAFLFRGVVAHQDVFAMPLRLS